MEIRTCCLIRTSMPKCASIYTISYYLLPPLSDFCYIQGHQWSNLVDDTDRGNANSRFLGLLYVGQHDH